MKFVDTNVFLRFLINDDPVKAAACRELLKRAAAGEEELYTSESVIGEIFYVLTRGRPAYRVDRVELAERVKPLVATRGLRMPQKAVVQRALDVYIQYSGFDFEDALSVGHMEVAGVSEIVSYDEDFDELQTVRRVGP